MSDGRVRAPPELIPLLLQLSGFFESRGVKAYATGGFVRDLLLERPVTDLDISVDADPLELGPRLAVAPEWTYFTLDEERRHARILVPHTSLQIDLMPLRGAIEEDLRLRDFTINASATSLQALAVGPAEIIDPIGGSRDLSDGVVRLVSGQALVDDPLRMLRAVRFRAQLGFEIEAETVASIEQHAALLRSAALERQRDELMLILASEHAGRALRELDRFGLLAHLLPELDVTRGVEQPKQHHWDVFNHHIEAVTALDWMLLGSEPEADPQRAFWRELWESLEWWPDARAYLADEVSPGYKRWTVLKLTALLHDIGKPETKSTEAGGRTRFFGHADVGADIASRLLRRLRFPEKVIAHARAMIGAHLRPLLLVQKGAPSRRAVYRYFRDTEGAGIDTLFLSLSDHLATAGPLAGLDGWRRHLAVVSYLLATHFDSPPAATGAARLVAGEDLMEAFDLPPGPLIGDLLEAIKEGQALGDVKTREDALELARKQLEPKQGKR